jgi:hypothetical protein
VNRDPLAQRGTCDYVATASDVTITVFSGAEMAAIRSSMNMAQRALDDLRAELATTRQERDRYLARMLELQARLDVVREVAK